MVMPERYTFSLPLMEAWTNPFRQGTISTRIVSTDGKVRQVTLDTEIRFLKGVGEKRAGLYHKLDISTVGDLIRHFPREYIDLSNPFDISGAPVGEVCAIAAVVTSRSGEQRIRKGLSLFKIQATDDAGGRLEITLFNNKYLAEALKPGGEYIFYGRVGGTLLRREMSAPAVFPAAGEAPIVPVYPQTAGLTSRMIRGNIKQAIGLLGELPETLPYEIRREYGLSELNFSIRSIHFPQSLHDAGLAQHRFIFEELLTLSLALDSVRAQKAGGSAAAMEQADLRPFYGALPFTPTDAQLRCIAEAIADMRSTVPMNRLIQGDVGSGKTLVAAACAYFAWKNGFQSVIMAPTGILAEQHYHTMREILGKSGMAIALLTGATKAAEKKQLRQQLARGELDFCVGTHALLSEENVFHNLGLVITDEQHRFGVAQRAALSQKGENAHVLVMSATPIPRTLALIIYGDLNLSVIDQMPPGRREIKTYRIDSSKRDRAFGFIRKHLDKGLQAYIVCPLIEQGEADLGLKPAAEYAEQLANGPFREYSVGLLHGRMKASDKEETMRRFKAGEIRLLISTTVIEVGVDVPNAVIMMIENAERFGLSQLHQLRGRIGRGAEQSHCILLSDSQGEDARYRLNMMCKTSDGFQIADADLSLRGPGDFFGRRQHGLPQLKVSDLLKDVGPLKQAQECAGEIAGRDPGLALPEHQALKEAVERMLHTVGERLN